MRTINIGRLNKRITFMKLTEEKDKMGQLKQVLTEVGTVWASFYPIRGTEFYEAQKVQSKITHKCYIRYRNDIDTNSYIRYDGKNFVIDSVIDVGYEHKMLEINCYEYTNKGSVPDE